jgi:polysaccharide export outer membrane protein
MMRQLVSSITIGGFLACCLMQAQTPLGQTPPGVQAPPPGFMTMPPQAEAFGPNYVLGAGDQIQLRALQVEEIGDRPYRVDSEGNINLPLLGRIHVAGMTVEKAEALIAERMKTLVNDPQVMLMVIGFRSEPVFFVGAFKTPGIYPLQGRHTLMEMLTSIGGLAPNAGRRIKITRRTEFGKLPLPRAVDAPDGKSSSAEISLGSMKDNVNPADDIPLQPYDQVSAEKAEMVYVNGEVGKVGSIELGERESVSVTQLLTLAGGLSKDAAPEQARILRPIFNTSRRAEIPVNLKRVLEGKDNDFPVMANDVLYVPRSSRRAVWSKVGYVAIPIIPTLIYILAR